MDGSYFSLKAIMVYCTLILIYVLYQRAYKIVYLRNDNRSSRRNAGIFFAILLYGVVAVFIRLLLIQEDIFTFEVFILYSILVTSVIWLIAHQIAKNSYPSKHFESKWENGEMFPTYKEIKSVESWKVSVYTRVSIRNISLPESEELIFDSSDFDVINRALGTTDGHQPSIEKGRPFTFKGEDYITDEVKVDFMCLFDDYGASRTEVKEGKDTPYNIQIFINCKKQIETERLSLPLSESDLNDLIELVNENPLNGENIKKEILSEAIKLKNLELESLKSPLTFFEIRSIDYRIGIGDWKWEELPKWIKQEYGKYWFPINQDKLKRIHDDPESGYGKYD